MVIWKAWMAQFSMARKKMLIANHGQNNDYSNVRINKMYKTLGKVRKNK